MTNKRVSWKQDKILSVETRKGVYVLAQMLKEPYLRFYKKFSEDQVWDKTDTHTLETLFVVSVTRQFLKSSNITEIKNALPDTQRKDSDIWIKQNNGSRRVKVYENTENEKEFFILGDSPGGSLVKKDLNWAPTPKNPTRAHSSGVVDAVLVNAIPLNDHETINKYELTNLEIYPGLNERLYLCYKLNKNIDPYKDLVFNRDISSQLSVAIEIMAAGGNQEKREMILNTYFR